MTKEDENIADDIKDITYNTERIADALEKIANLIEDERISDRLHDIRTEIGYLDK